MKMLARTMTRIEVMRVSLNSKMRANKCRELTINKCAKSIQIEAFVSRGGTQ